MRRAKLKAHDVTRVIITATMSEKPETVESLMKARRSAGFFDVGWHYFIDRNARVHYGVPGDERHSYFERYGRTSVVILMDGNGDYSEEQFLAMNRLIQSVRTEFPKADPTLHHELFWGTNPAFDKEKINGE